MEIEVILTPLIIFWESTEQVACKRLHDCFPEAKQNIKRYVHRYDYATPEFAQVR